MCIGPANLPLNHGPASSTVIKICENCAAERMRSRMMANYRPWNDPEERGFVDTDETRFVSKNKMANKQRIRVRFLVKYEPLSKISARMRNNASQSDIGD